jgi:hypothetical protein
MMDRSNLYYPHLNQLKIHHDQARYRVVVAGRRFGKTAMALNEALTWIMSPKLQNQMVWIILPHYKEAHDIYWIDPDINKYFMPYVHAGFLKKNDTELSLFSAKNNSRLVLKGADEPDSLRGSGLDLIIWDETADMKPNAFSVISPTLADSPYHRVMYMGTPDGYNHFHDFALRGDHQGLIEKAGKQIIPEKDWATYKFTSYDNMAWAEGSAERRLFVEYLEKERAYYEQIGQGDWFEQEYMAEFRKRAGAVHKMFSRTVHLIPDQVLPKEWERDRGWDWGSSHPTASIRFAIDPDSNWFVEMSYKQKDDYIENHANHIKEQDKEFLSPDGSDPIPGFGDPSGKQWISEFNKLGFSIRAAKKAQNTEKKTWTELAIDKINAKLAPRKGHTVFLPDGTKIEDAPSLFILNRPENMALVDEMETLSYKETNQGLTKTELDDTNDKMGHYDLHASFRYFAITQGQQTYFVPLVNNITREQLIEAQIPRAKTFANEDERKRLEHQADLDAIASQNLSRQTGGFW